MKTLFSILFIVILTSCTQKSSCTDCESCGLNLNVKEVTMEEALTKAKSAPTQVDTTELQESIAKIEEKYGEQWDFCDCVIKGDSINKAFSKPNLPDAEFDRLAKRFDEIDEKCQAFRIQDANRTPEQRAAHEKRVRKCLRDAGIKN
ncbi:MAG: hypothetical protein RI922_891 [Bacteroidota bacterium]